VLQKVHRLTDESKSVTGLVARRRHGERVQELRDQGTEWRRKAAFCLTVRRVAVFAAAELLF
jgi:hypothetical protein